MIFRLAFKQFRFRSAYVLAAAVSLAILGGSAAAQTLEQQLAAESPSDLARAARELGDPARGAILFFQNHMACGKCHAGDDPQSRLGPDLARLGETAGGESPVTDEHLVEAVLVPSKVIRTGSETTLIVTAEGRSGTGQVHEERAEALVLRDAAEVGRIVTIPLSEIEERKNLANSLMPEGQVNQLASRQQFLDLLRYLLEIRDGGPRRALELKPDPALLTAQPLPEYEAHIDHAGMIRALDGDNLKRGEAIYLRVCANCHGTHEAAGSLPTALRFAEGRFKNGSDPWAMYQTLTRGFGFMTPQTWMAPRQKYDVIHYIREAYLKTKNPSQYAALDSAYLERLPAGDTFGPEPSTLEPWVVMDYGDRLINTYEVPTATSGAGPNLAYKGNAAPPAR